MGEDLRLNDLGETAMFFLEGRLSVVKGRKEVANEDLGIPHPTPAKGPSISNI